MTEIIALAQATQEQINALRFAERESRTIIPVLAAIAANVKAMLGRKKHNVALVRTIRDATRAMLNDWQNGYIDNLEGFGASIVESTVDGIDALVEPNVFEAQTQIGRASCRERV